MDTYSEHDIIDAESERMLMAEFSVGVDVEDFLRTTTGRLVAGRAAQDIAEAIRTLLDIDLERNKDQAIRAQLKARHARQTMAWLLSAIADAELAEQRLKEMDNEELGA